MVGLIVGLFNRQFNTTIIDPLSAGFVIISVRCGDILDLIFFREKVVFVPFILQVIRLAFHVRPSLFKYVSRVAPLILGDAKVLRG